MPSLFELVYSGENALHITLTNFYAIYLSCAPEIQSILRCESSVLEKEVDNPRRYCLSSVCNQVVVTNGTVRHVLSMSTGYCSYLEFIEAVGVETVKVLPLVSMTIEEENVKFNVQEHGWYFDNDSDNTTIDNIDWTPWSKLFLSTLNMCIIRSLYGSVYDLNDLFLHDVMNDQGL